MAYSARILADSTSPAGHRLTSFEITFPRFILAEFNTHRMFSRNSASSRAIPVKKQLQRILSEPFIPEQFGINQKGMEAADYLSGIKHEEAVRIWLRGRNRAVHTALELLLGWKPTLALSSSPAYDELLRELGPLLEIIEDPADTDILNVHKQTANRVLEPYMWHTVIVTATEWGNFWGLRAHPAAQPEIQKIALLMKELYEGSRPQELQAGEWHLPLVGVAGDEDLSEDDRVKVCAGRCARVSYLTHDGVRDPQADIALHDRLVASGHMSPCEHPARPMTEEELQRAEWSGNFRGFHQYRKDIKNESDYSEILAAIGQS